MSIGNSDISFSQIYNAINNSSGTIISMNNNFRNVPFTDSTNTNSSLRTKLSLSQFRNKTILKDYTVGSGTSRNTYHPCYSYYNMSDSCQIYRNDELAAIGLNGSTIGSVAWEFESNNPIKVGDARSTMKIYCANIDNNAGAPVDTGYRSAAAGRSYDTYVNRPFTTEMWHLVYNGAYNIPNVYNNAQWINFPFGTGDGTYNEFIHEDGKSLAISVYSPYEDYIANGQYVAALGNGETKLSSHYHTDQQAYDPNIISSLTMSSGSYRPKVKLTPSGFGGRLIGGGGFN